MQLLLAFLLGALCGTSVFMLYCWFRLKEVKKTLMDQLKAKTGDLGSKKDSIKDRLFRASDIAKAQMIIRSQMELPSKNATHSRYKNGLVSELQDLELKKLDLLKTVLAEGFDPTITVINEAGAQQEIPLSAYVNEASGQLNASLGATPPSNDPTQPKKASKFILYKGGKDDGTTH